MKSILVGLLILGFASNAIAATVLDNFDRESGTISGLGENASPYIGQSFIAESGYVQDLTFKIATFSTTNTPFSVLLVETQPGSSTADVGLHPTNILFESGQINVSQIGDSLVTVNLGGLDLVDGSTYAWLVDGASFYDGQAEDTVSFYMDFSGEGIEGVNFHYFSDQLTGNRDTDFANENGWLVTGPDSIPPRPPSDLLFRLGFSDIQDTSRAGDITIENLEKEPIKVSESSSLYLLAFGLLGLLGSARRKV